MSRRPGQLSVEAPPEQAAEVADGGAEISSLLPGFYRLPLADRRGVLSQLGRLDSAELEILSGGSGLRLEQADAMIENAIGVLGVPLGLCTNLRVDGRDRLVAMATEEPSVVAAASHAAKLLRAGGGLHTEVTPPIMEGQIQILDVPEAARAKAAILEAKSELLARANANHPHLIGAGGGAFDLEVRELEPFGTDDPLPSMMIVHVLVHVAEAMGANAVNSICEELAPHLQAISGGRVRLRIMSNLCDRRLVTVVGSLPISALSGQDEREREDLARGVMEASVFAERDPHRAATHNKGIMNGVDAVLLACGQDFRAIEAGAHAFAARAGRYGPLARWRVREARLEGVLTMPLAVGIVGGAAVVHPTVRLLLRLAKIERASELASVAASVGLAQNLAALRALAAEGIQRGHMRLHARKASMVGVPVEVPQSAAGDAPGADGEAGVAGVRGAPGNSGAFEHPFAEEDAAFCKEILPRVSRTFALSIEALPAELREPVRTAYLLCRLVDTVEDEADLDPEHRQLLFAKFDAALQDGEEYPTNFAADIAALTCDGDGGALCRGAGAVLRMFAALAPERREVIRTRLLEMSRGMRVYSARGDVEGGRRIRDLDDLERYCYFVAGTVGKLLTDLFEWTVPGLSHEKLSFVRSRAVNFGIGLQMVNILKDVAPDLERADCFLPQSLAAGSGVTLERVLDPAHRDAGLAIIRQVAARARFHLERAGEYTQAWSLPHGAPVRLFCIVPLLLAFGTLNLVERGDDVLRAGREPKVSREFVADVLLRGRDAVKDDAQLASLLRAHSGRAV